MADIFEPFKDFDPLIGKVPFAPFSNLSDIADRARWLLRNRTTEQIKAIVRDIDWQIDEYFYGLREKAIDSLKDNDYQQITDKHNYRDPYTEKERTIEIAVPVYCYQTHEWEWEDDGNFELDVPLREDSSEIEAFKECEDYWCEIASEELPDGKIYEFFAALSLWMLADTIYFIENNSLSLAGEYAIKAMDAICYAENLREVEHIKTAHTLELAQTLESCNTQNTISYAQHLQEIENIKNTYESELVKTHDALNKQIEALQELVRLQQEEEVKKKAERASQLNKNRHRKNHTAREMVIAEWLKDKSKFSSAEKAGNYLVDWLFNQGFQYETRTITNWIRDYAKQNGIKLR